MSAMRHPVPVMSMLLHLAGCATPPPPVHAVVPLDGLRDAIDIGAPLGARVSFLRAGPVGARRLILVHGTPGRAAQWADYLVEPPRGLEVVALDRPGFGASDPEGAVVSLEAQAAAVAALLGPPDQPSILLGHSLGGPIVALVAARHPDRVAAVIFLAAAVDPALERIHPMQYVGAWAPVRTVLGRQLRNANTELMALKPELERLVPQLGAVRAPTVIVHGTDDDRVPFANVAYLQRMLHGACHVETMALPRANHFLPWTDAKSVRAAIDRASALSC